MRHTEGPWVAERNAMGELAIFTKKGKHTLSCEGGKPLPLKQREANAALQAAAPSLLEVLQAVVAELERWPGSENPEFFAGLKAARRTIAQFTTTTNEPA